MGLCFFSFFVFEIDYGPLLTRSATWANALAQRALALFSFLYFKKQNFKNICRIRKFLKMGDCRPSNWRQDLNVKNLHLDPGAQGALNSKFVKLI